MPVYHTPLSRLYQVQKRIRSALTELAASSTQAYVVQVPRPMGTEAERAHILAQFQKADEALAQHAELAGLYVKLRQEAASAALPASRLTAELEILRVRLEILSKFQENPGIPVPLDDLSTYVKLPQTQSIGPFSLPGAQVVRPDGVAFQAGIKAQHEALQHRSIWIQDEIARVNQRRVKLELSDDEFKLLSRFIG